MKLTASPKVLISVFVLMFLLILVSSKYLTGTRLDLSENGLYTLSKGTVNILHGLDKPVSLTLYFSDKASSQLPALRTYEQRVEELLHEYVANSNAKLSFNKVDPEPFSEAEDEATSAGLQGVPSGAQGDNIYFGLVAKNEAGAQEIIPFMQPDREAYLEYELTRLVSSLSRTHAPKVGIYSGIEINGGFDYMQRQARPVWSIMDYIQKGFDVEWIEDDATEIKDIDVLLLIAPQNISKNLQFAIDQFVLKGGRTLIFLDPYSEALAQQGGAPSVQRSDLSTLLPGWGLSLRKDVIVTDFANSMVVGVGQSRQPTRHIGLLSLDAQALQVDPDKTEDILLQGLESINLSSAGILDVEKGATTKVTPLIMSSDQSKPQAAELLTTLNDPKVLMNDFTPTGERYLMAARVSGAAKTAFPDGIEITFKSDPEKDKTNSAPTILDKDSAHQSKENKATEEKKTLKPEISESKDIHLLVVSDSDMLSDRLWIQVQNFFGQKISTPWADNGSFLVNSLDNFSGNPDLIEIRSQGRFNRPFSRVNDLRLAAEQHFQTQQEVLQNELKTTESKLVDLEKLRGKNDGTAFSKDQEKELQNFQQEKLKIRKQLRDVQHQLDQDIENLGTQLKLVNIFLIPFFICLLVLVNLIRRRFSR